MAALGGRQPISFSFLDYSGESKSVRLYANEITALSLPGFLTDLGALATALDNVTLGTRARQAWGEETVVSNTRPASKNAQVESELLVRCRGAVGQAPFSFRIPTVDYDAFNYIDDEVIISGAGATAATLALVTAIQTIAKMPDDETEAVVVLGMNVVR